MLDIWCQYQMFQRKIYLAHETGYPDIKKKTDIRFNYNILYLVFKVKISRDEFPALVAELVLNTVPK